MQKCWRPWTKGYSERKIANDYGIGKGTVSRIKVNRTKLEETFDFTGNVPEHLKKRKFVQISPRFELIEKAVVEFLKTARERGIAVTRTMLRTLAEKEAKKSDIQGFCASEGWLGKLKSRHGISGRNLKGEAAGVDNVVITDWMKDIPELIKRYHPKDIFKL